MKIRRSGRLVDITSYLLENPLRLVSLSFFADRYGAAKSSISEDLAIVKSTFEKQGIGSLYTVPGAAGGVKYIPLMDKESAKEVIEELCDHFSDTERLLPGGYLYLTDILGNPRLVRKVGRLFASAFAKKNVDVVMTMATKGIPLAHAVASYLNVPVVIVRRDSRVTEGSTVSINYVSGSTNRIQTMVLARRSLATGSNVLIIDDFMKAGGTISGMVNLLGEFQATVAGIGVLLESEEDTAERLVENYISLVSLSEIDIKQKHIRVEKGNYFECLSKL